MSSSYYRSYICTNVASALKSEGTYSVFTELTLVIDGKDYIPDVSVYPKRKIEWRKRDIIRMTEMPLTAIEIVSPSQALDEALSKFEVYFHARDVIDPVLNIRIPITAIFESCQTL